MKYTVEGKGDIDLLDDTDWDLCVLIDSCRWESFWRQYRTFLNGELKKAYSHCSCTREFMQNHLNRPYIDIVYVNHAVSIGWWIPNTKFFKLVDVWKTHWDYDTWGTIRPEPMTDVTLEMLERHPEKRIMLHYVQAHPPYMMDILKDYNKIKFTPERCIEMKEKGKKESFNFHSFTQGVMRRYLGYTTTWRLLKLLHIEPDDYYGKLYTRFGPHMLQQGYDYNVFITLKEIARLLRNFRGKVLVTADHSQKLNGDRRGVEKEPIPWLEIKC